jgi:hypothetical protein
MVPSGASSITSAAKAQPIAVRAPGEALLNLKGVCVLGLDDDYNIVERDQPLFHSRHQVFDSVHDRPADFMSA